MKRTLAFLFAAVASAALAQTPTVVEKPATKSASQAKAVVQTPAQSSKPSPTTSVKVVPVSAHKPGAVVAKPATAPSAPAKVVVVPAARTNAAASAKAAAVATPAKPVAVAAPAARIAVAPAKPVAAGSGAKPLAAPAKTDPFKASAAQKAPAKTSKTSTVTAKGGSTSQTTVAVKDNRAANDSKPAKVISAVGRRDPFVSPVVNLGAIGSGCSSGKRCLAIDQVALKGVVKSDSGMIAVVVNAMDKAYFLRENDPVFNGYVVKITGDSIVFKETFRDKLGKPLTRDVTKTISRPVA